MENGEKPTGKGRSTGDEVRLEVPIPLANAHSRNRKKYRSATTMRNPTASFRTTAWKGSPVKKFSLRGSLGMCPGMTVPYHDGINCSPSMSPSLRCSSLSRLCAIDAKWTNEMKKEQGNVCWIRMGWPKQTWQRAPDIMLQVGQLASLPHNATNYAGFPPYSESCCGCRMSTWRSIVLTTACPHQLARGYMPTLSWFMRASRKKINSCSHEHVGFLRLIEINRSILILHQETQH